MSPQRILPNNLKYMLNVDAKTGPQLDGQGLFTGNSLLNSLCYHWPCSSVPNDALPPQPPALALRRWLDSSC